MTEQLEPQQPTWKIWHQLPDRPPPAELESLTSYLTRVAQANGLQKVTELVTLAGGIPSTWQSLCSFPDGSAMNVPGLTTLTEHTQPDLEALTFLPLGRHFGRANSTQTLRRFLQSSLAPYLRYCPMCLAEHKFPYYRLPWRFLPLSGCVTHQCQLLDHCGHCGARIPLLPDHPDLSVCPTCRRDLRTCQSSPLSEDTSRLLPQRTSDLIFLLCSPVQSQEEAPRVAAGKRYAFIRQQRGFSLQEAASLTGLNPKSLLEIEHAGPYRQETFLDYIQYTDLLDYPLEEILSMPDPSMPFDEEAFLAHVDEAIQEWTDQEHFTKLSINKHIGVPIKLLKKYPRTKSRLQACKLQRNFIIARKNQQREEELVQLVMSAINQLEALKEPVTQERIAKMVGVTTHGLRFYPRVEALLMPVANKHWNAKNQSYLVSAQQRMLSLANEPVEEATDERVQS